MSTANVDLEKLSVFLCGVLRHRPEKIGLKLDKQGWVAIDELLARCNANGRALTREQLEQIVREDEKGRYGMTAYAIRCCQGHSTLQVALTFSKGVPPPRLYHGTSSKALPAILKEGLTPQRRHHVHLSADVETATAVGGRRKNAELVILNVDARGMLAAGHPFYISENNVWLADAVPARFLRV
ncbi:RNA 2'-phosphotransferase [Paraburkholderia sp. UCT31]|uniref:RNA 2'-phosphotransferase n=1 Tax=Paraburkholderia sp. UCT31 TaxID=2615209 RepID=UPI001655F4D9|nr:RNA 2'-phosphotransferase [Paraburkholderia sp. UCT31]MBC8739756.1 RNA 2'-phosphotransferase [Paraburkholderia sp. UCT31]